MNAWDALSAKHIPTFASVADDISLLRGDIEKELASGPLAKSLSKAFVPINSRLADIEASLRRLEQGEAGFSPRRPAGQRRRTVAVAQRSGRF